MSAKAATWAGTQKVPPRAAIVLQALADESCDLGHCGVHDVRELAQKCGIAERTIHRTLKFLRSTGRLFVHRQCSVNGLQIQSAFELNLDRPADAQHPPPSRRPAKAAEPNSGCSANLAERVPAGTAKLAVPTSAQPCQQAVVVNSINRKQQQHQQSTAHTFQVRELVTRLHVEMGLSYMQAAAMCEQYSKDHLRDAVDHVSARNKTGLIRNPAGYLLTVLRDAPPGSLSSEPMRLVAPSAKKAEQQIAKDVAGAGERIAARQETRRAEDEWNVLDTSDKDALWVQFMAHLAVDNHIVFDSLRRTKDPRGGVGHRLLMDWWTACCRETTRLRIAAGATEDD